MMTSMPSGRSRGIAMLEVAVAMVVLSASFLGIALVLAKNAREQRSAHFMGRAAQMATDMAERMQANRGAALAGGYLVGGTYAALAQPDINTPICGGLYTRPPAIKLNLPACTTTADAAAYDMANWRVQIQTSLAGGAGAILAPANAPANARTIVIAWSEPATDKKGGSPSPVVDSTCASQAPGLNAPAGVRCYVMDIRL